MKYQPKKTFRVFPWFKMNEQPKSSFRVLSSFSVVKNQTSLFQSRWDSQEVSFGQHVLDRPGAVEEGVHEGGAGELV